MGKKWDTVGNFYEWCKLRAKELHRVIKPGGFVLIFGHPKTNHRMKCAFEDVGFNIVEEIDWIYGTGFPKNQDIGKLFDKKAGAKREIIGEYQHPDGKPRNPKNHSPNKDVRVADHNWGLKESGFQPITEPSTDQAIKWNGWKTAGLKPAHEPITVFQKPLEGTYINNINIHKCGGMNIDACRVPLQEYGEDKRLGGKGTWSTEKAAENIYEGGYAGERVSSSEIGRFPANVIFDTYMGEVLDNQSGERASGSGNGNAKVGESSQGVTPLRRGTLVSRNDSGGASRFFLNIDAENFVPFLYCPKATKKEKGEGNIHVTVKPKALIKWLIKLVTPKDGTTIDITAGSCTHGLSCEELNRDEGYNLKWINIEMMNTEKEPYCDIAKKRILDVVVENT
jgi:site-specific DNA-methyltransferase (adenine-specific)